MTPAPPVSASCHCGARLLVSFRPPPPADRGKVMDQFVCPRCGEYHDSPGVVRQAFVEEAGRWKQFFPYGVE